MPRPDKPGSTTTLPGEGKGPGPAPEPSEKPALPGLTPGKSGEKTRRAINAAVRGEAAHNPARFQRAPLDHQADIPSGWHQAQ